MISNIYLSSTIIDLEDERKAIRENLLKNSFNVTGFEDISSSTNSVLEEHLNAIKKSNIYILILGHKYGPIFTESGISLIETEYNYANENQLPVLVYFKDEKVKILPFFIETSPDSLLRLANFKKHLEKRHTIKKFLSPSTLANQVLNDVNRLIPFISYSQKNINKKQNGENLKCAIVLPFGPQFREIYEKVLIPILKSFQINSELIETAIITDELSLTIPQKLLQADFVIFDITNLEPSICFNLGCLSILNRNVILIARSFRLSNLKISNYELLDYNHQNLNPFYNEFTGALSKLVEIL